jgi:orotidine-5'-phosphate decarboxylase
LQNSFANRFLALSRERGHLCVGIDPSSEALAAWDLPDDLSGLVRFCDTLVGIAAPRAAVIKPQSAFFERFGPDGMQELKRVVRQARAGGALTIVDAKRGDLGSTATAYGDAFLGAHSAFGSDAVTAHAYLGIDSLAPLFTRAKSHGAAVFVVVRSSNPEGTFLQLARTAGGLSVAESFCEAITRQNAAADVGPIGAVVGATLGDETAGIVARLPNALFLAPGLGAQGATLVDVKRNFGAAYARCIPSVSRAIALAGPNEAALVDCIERFADESRLV